MLGDGEEDKELGSEAEVALAFPSAVLLVLVLAPADEAEVIGASVGNVDEEVVLLAAAVALTPAAAAEGNAATGEVGEGLLLCRLSFPCPSPCA